MESYIKTVIRNDAFIMFIIFIVLVAMIVMHPPGQAG